MATNYEIAHGKVIPSFRRAVAIEMTRTYNLNQVQIARYLGVTQAAVSKYLNSNGKISVRNKYITEFIESVVKGDYKAGKDAMCKACQSGRSFDCAFMFKQ